MNRISSIAAVLLLLLAAPASAQGCTLSPSDQRWVEGALRSWEGVAHEELRLDPRPAPPLVLFDARCVWYFGEAPVEAPARAVVRHGSAVLRARGAAHGGRIVLPGGDTVPAGLMSFTSAAGPRGVSFLVMSLPALWRAAPHLAAEPNRDRLVMGVFVHEMTHTRQAGALRARLDAIEKMPGMAEGFDDDVVQTRFAGRPGFRAAYERERDLLFAAAAEREPARRRARAGEAVRAIDERRARYFTGADSLFAETEDLFLSLEGAANWAAYRLALRGGMREPEALALIRRGGRKWAQDEGLALFLALDALVPGWQRRVFSARPASPLALLREAAR